MQRRGKMNQVFLIGRMTKEPELSRTGSGTARLPFSLAVDREYTKNGEKETDFIPVVVWGKLAENCAKYIGKGSLVAIQGRLQVRRYQTQDGKNRTITEVVATNAQFLDRRKPAAADPESDMKYEMDFDFDTEDAPF